MVRKYPRAGMGKAGTVTRWRIRARKRREKLLAKANQS